jgi:DNA invertase Pin-like site-specific DNA recombinase
MFSPYHLRFRVRGWFGQGSASGCSTGQGANIDTTTANGRLVLGIFAALAEFERELIRERTITGRASARGRNGERPYTMTPAKLRLAQAAMAKHDTKVASSARNWV